MPGSASGNAYCLPGLRCWSADDLAEGHVGAQRGAIDVGNQRVRECLTFLGQKPVDEQFRRVRMRRVGKCRDAAAGTRGADHADLLGQEKLFDRQSLFRQRAQFFFAGGDELHGESAADEPGFQNSAVVREGYAGARSDRFAPTPGRGRARSKRRSSGGCRMGRPCPGRGSCLSSAGRKYRSVS